MSKPVVGCVGLGLMGGGIARRLIETGHAVAGYDIVPAKVAAAAKWGVEARASPADVARARRYRAAVGDLDCGGGGGRAG